MVFQEESPLVLAGTLKFDALYDPGKDQCVINPGERAGFHGERIQDSYEIKIRFETSEYSDLPQVYETAGRIDRIAQERKKKRTDLHIQPSGAACLCLKMQENEYLPNGFNLPDYFCKLVIPFFYGQSYFEKHGKWPWGEYSHGELGYLEGYGEIGEDVTIESVLDCIELLKKCGRKWAFYESQLRKVGGLNVHRYLCFCGSGKKIRKCHLRAFRGLSKLKEDIKRFSIQI